MIFIKLGAVRAITIEFNKEFGVAPLLKKTSYREETILDMPYTQVIFTSGKWTPLRRAANGNDSTTEIAEDSKDSSGTGNN